MAITATVTPALQLVIISVLLRPKLITTAGMMKRLARIRFLPGHSGEYYYYINDNYGDQPF